jgi:predicted nucleic acid-binding protein
MMLLDTSILSLAYRRKYRLSENRPREVDMLQKLIDDNEVLGIPGIVGQEFLSGIREEAQFNKLLELIRNFPIILATFQHHLEAAKIANLCRRSGVATSATDCLIAAIAIEQQMSLFTADQDFFQIARHCPLRLFPEVPQSV